MIFSRFGFKYVKLSTCILCPASISLGVLLLKRDKHKLLAESELKPFEAEYVIVGSGPTAYSALRTIRYLEPTSKVLIATDSTYLPYERYPLNFEAWFSNDFHETYEYESRFQASNKFLFYQPESFYASPPDLESADTEYGGQALLLKHAVDRIEPEKFLAHLRNGDKIKYRKCLLALGSKSPLLSCHIPHNLKRRFHILDSLDDFKKVEASLNADKHDSVAILGDSLKALEFAACQSLIFKDNNTQRKVTLVCSKKFLSDFLPEVVSEWIKTEMEKSGIEIKEKVNFEALRVSTTISNKVGLNTGKENVEVDDVVAMLPRIANTQLARNSSFEIDVKNKNTIVADSTLKIREGVYAAGSCVSVYHPFFKSRVSFDLPDHSVMSGRFAAFNMIGKIMPYFKMPRYVADFGADLGFDGVGRIDPNLETRVFFVHKKDKPIETDSTQVEEASANETAGSESSEEAETVRFMEVGISSNVTAVAPEKLEASQGVKGDHMLKSSSEHTNDAVAGQPEPDVDISGSESESLVETSIKDEPIASCAVIYVDNGTVVGVATVGAYGRMFIAEHMISKQVTVEQLNDYIPLLLATNFSVRKASEDDDDQIFP